LMKSDRIRKLQARRKTVTDTPRSTPPNESWGVVRDQDPHQRRRLGLARARARLALQKVVGHYAGLQARAWHRLVALNRLLITSSRSGSRPDLHLMTTSAALRSPSCASVPARHPPDL
jgi:hypothetical protein